MGFYLGDDQSQIGVCQARATKADEADASGNFGCSGFAAPAQRYDRNREFKQMGGDPVEWDDPTNRSL